MVSDKPQKRKRGMRRFGIPAIIIISGVVAIMIGISWQIAPYMRYIQSNYELEQNYQQWQTFAPNEHIIAVDFGHYHPETPTTGILTIGLMSTVWDAEKLFDEARRCVETVHCTIWYNEEYGVPTYIYIEGEPEGWVVTYFEVSGRKIFG